MERSAADRMKAFASRALVLALVPVGVGHLIRDALSTLHLRRRKVALELCMGLSNNNTAGSLKIARTP